MIRPDHARVTSLFLAAAELSPTERQTFLEQACAGDVELRAEVESLLGHDHDHDHDRGDLVQTGDAVRRLFEAPLPARIGPYAILSKLGEGGMGVVFLAEQSEPVQRKVALKLVRTGLDTPELRGRFQAEYVALASLAHPNIARVLDVGTTEDGRPYFAMEYVEGEPITECCERRRLGIVERIELFRPVCAAVQHAHQNAVIHRDIKPSNILVTERDGTLVPTVIDFGVARVLHVEAAGRERATTAGQVLGTPEYMSPEQAEGAGGVDTRTDVYSLGAVLYELLAGSPPIGDPSGRLGIDELRRRIRAEDVPAPSTRFLSNNPKSIAEHRGTDPHALRRELRGDLDRIVLKALQRDRGRRYASPAELSADLGRHLAHEPVLAGPGGALYPIGKFVRKHRIGVAAATVLLAAVGLSAAAFLARARQAAVAAQVTGLLEVMFQRPMIVSRVDVGPPTAILQPGIDRVRRELRGQPALQGRLLRMLGEASTRLGDPHAARPVLEEAHSMLARELGQEHAETLAAADALAQTLAVLHDEGAERLYQETLAARRASLGADHPDTLRSAVRLGYLYKEKERSVEARELLAPAVDGLRRTLGNDQTEALIAAGFLAGVELDLDHFDKTVESVLLELAAKLPARIGERNIESLAAEYNLGCLYAARGDRETALEHLGRAIERGFFAGPYKKANDRELASQLKDPRFQRLSMLEAANDSSTWDGRNFEAGIADSQGRHLEAERIYREIIAAADRVGQPDHRAALSAREALAVCYTKQGRWDMLEGLTRSYPASWQDSVDWYLYLCRLHRGQRQDALGSLDRLRANASPSSADFAYLTAVRYAVLGDREAARRSLVTTIERHLDYGWWVQYDIAFDPYRGEPAFRTLLSQLAAQRPETP